MHKVLKHEKKELLNNFHYTDCAGPFLVQSTKNSGFRGSQVLHMKSWKDGIVRYSFVSNSNDWFEDDVFLVDPKIGWSKAESDIVKRAMKNIEEVSCVRFEKFDPSLGHVDFMVIMRETSRDNICLADYINNDLREKIIPFKGQILTKVFENLHVSPFCGSGSSYVSSGNDLKIIYMVTNIMPRGIAEHNVGHFTHELMHAIGFGHTQNRGGNIYFPKTISDN